MKDVIDHHAEEDEQIQQDVEEQCRKLDDVYLSCGQNPNKPRTCVMRDNHVKVDANVVLKLVNMESLHFKTISLKYTDSLFSYILYYC